MKTIVLVLALLAWPAMSHGQEQTKPPGGPHDDHAAHGQPADQEPADRQPYPPGIAPPTDEDRAAAFPVLARGHAAHREMVHYYVLVDEFEWRSGGDRATVTWDTKGWIGRDVNRFWFRTEGEGKEGRPRAANVHALFGRAISPWWHAVAGVRQDVRPGPAQTWAAVGLHGLAPQWFELEVTAYLGASGRTHLRFETEYQLLLTNRLVLQPKVEFEAYGKPDQDHGFGRGVSTVDAGLRLRYEIRRELAPYVGIAWSRSLFGTADLAEAAGEAKSAVRLVSGVRVWF